jgi:hypothetical protein
LIDENNRSSHLVDAFTFYPQSTWLCSSVILGRDLRSFGKRSHLDTF